MRLIVAMIVLCVLIIAANARDDGRYAQSPLKEWFEQLQNQSGNNCCSGADGQRVEDPDWEFDGDRYRVKIDGVWHQVTPNGVVTAKNRVGYAIVWPYVQDGKTLIRCFMPGAAI